MLVKRTSGSKGEVSVSWETREIGSATRDIDYVHSSGELVFGDGITSKSISVPIIDDGKYESDEVFQVVLSNPQGCSFAPNVDGGPEEAIATITIQSDITLRKDADRLAEMLHFNVDNVKLGAFNWAEQVRALRGSSVTM